MQAKPLIILVGIASNATFQIAKSVSSLGLRMAFIIKPYMTTMIRLEVAKQLVPNQYLPNADFARMVSPFPKTTSLVTFLYKKI
jgi:hypothetical protein